MAIPNYKEQTATATIWQRFCDIFLRNPLTGTKYVVYGEQRARQFDNGTVDFTPLGGIRKDFEPTDEFPMFDIGGNFVRMVPEAEYYAMMASHAIHIASLRDAGSPKVKRVPYPRVIIPGE